MGPALALGLIQGGLSIAGGMARNAAIEDAATKQYDANMLFIEREESVLQEQLGYAATEVQNELGAALSNLVVQARQARAAETAKSVEAGIYGNLAARKQGMIAMKEALATDSVMQSAESKITDVQTKMREVKYQTESRHAENRQSYNNMMSQRQSTFEIMAGGLSAGLSGYSAGQNLQLANNQLAMQQAQMKLFD